MLVYYNVIAGPNPTTKFFCYISIWTFIICKPYSVTCMRMSFINLHQYLPKYDLFRHPLIVIIQFFHIKFLLLLQVCRFRLLAFYLIRPRPVHQSSVFFFLSSWGGVAITFLAFWWTAILHFLMSYNRKMYFEFHPG